MKGKILIVEDVKDMADLIALYLTQDGLDVLVAEDAETALSILEDDEPDLILLDLNLPGMDGFEFLKLYRKKRDTPVIIVSARSADEDLISGFSTGADEFVTKPFSPRVLVARVRALMERIKNLKSSMGNVCKFGPYVLDFDACILKQGKERVPLSTKEYEVLAWLAKNPGKPASPETIYKEVWKNEYGDLTTVAVHIQRIRKKIERDPAQPEYIETVHGMGYRFCVS